LPQPPIFQGFSVSVDWPVLASSCIAQGPSACASQSHLLMVHPP
jgi:hypothetical protein